MRRTKRLQSIQRLAEHGADAASRDIGFRLQSLRAEEERLRQVQAYLEHYDLIVLSTPELNEVWVIDHSTTTEQAATGAGGRFRT